MSEPSEFEKAAAEPQSNSFVAELWGFLRENKKWWLLPIVVVLLLFGLLIVLSGTGLAPFIYTLF
jgi:drug/metabolite transporter superfamily protein YnfA